MKALRSVLALGVLLLGACSEGPTAPVNADLTGSWALNGSAGPCETSGTFALLGRLREFGGDATAVIVNAGVSSFVRSPAVGTRKRITAGALDLTISETDVGDGIETPRLAGEWQCAGASGTWTLTRIDPRERPDI